MLHAPRISSIVTAATKTRYTRGQAVHLARYRQYRHRLLAGEDDGFLSSASKAALTSEDAMKLVTPRCRSRAVCRTKVPVTIFEWRNTTSIAFSSNR